MSRFSKTSFGPVWQVTINLFHQLQVSVVGPLGRYVGIKINWLGRFEVGYTYPRTTQKTSRIFLMGHNAGPCGKLIGKEIKIKNSGYLTDRLSIAILDRRVRQCCSYQRLAAFFTLPRPICAAYHIVFISFENPISR